ncbi:MAG: hypothetical protein V3S30_11225 [Thermoanaerobaculia bacterium]
MAVGPYLRFVLLLCVIGLAMFAIGYLPTRKMIGPKAVSAILTGGGLSFFASMIGSVPVALMSAQGAQAGSTGALTSMLLRLFLVLGGSLGIAIVAPAHLNAILIWVGLSYLGFLFADVFFALSGIDQHQGAA